MKRLAIIQMTLGALIITSLFLFIEYVIPGYYYELMIDFNGNVIGRIFGLHKPNVLLDVWSFIYPTLGLAVFSFGVAQYLQARHKTINTVLTIIQVTLGVLIIASLMALIIWAEPHFEPYTRFIQNGTLEVIVQKDPNWKILQMSWKVVNFLLGLSVLGCGIAQSLKARK